MVTHYLQVEGGGSKDLDIRCQKAFRRLLERAGFTGRMPRIVACGGRNAVFDRFKMRHAEREDGQYVGMLIDSEDPVRDARPWEHLKQRDNWDQPEGSTDEQVLFMATCMETWIVVDRATLKKHYGQHLQETALPALVKIEERHRHEIQQSLMHATRDCRNRYEKGKKSFDLLEKALPEALAPHLSHFQRTFQILDSSL